MRAHGGGDLVDVPVRVHPDEVLPTGQQVLVRVVHPPEELDLLGIDLGVVTPRESLGTPAMDRIEDRDAREAQLVQTCMQGKGYSAMRR